MKYICRIGNNAQNDLVITDRTAADFHAHLIIDSDDRIWIKDLSTKYGTRVNGKKISKEELSYSDEVRIGFTTIDWIGFRNKWLEGQADFSVSNAQSEPKKQVLTNDSAGSEIFQQLANEAVKPKEEYNPKEINSSKKHEIWRISDEEIKPSAEMSEKSDHFNPQPKESIQDSEPESPKEILIPENSDKMLTEANSDAETNDEFTDSEELNIEFVDSKNVDTSSSESILDDSGQLDEQDISTKESAENKVKLEEKQEVELGQETQNEQEIHDNSTEDIEVTKPIALATSTGIRFDYRSSEIRKEQRATEPIVRIVAKTRVATFEAPMPKTRSVSKDTQLVMGVIVLVFSMLLIGWLLASMGSN